MEKLGLKYHYGFLICLAIGYLILTSCYSYAQLTWINKYQKQGNIIYTGSIQQTSDRGYIVVVDGATIMKLYPSGAIEWQKSYGGWIYNLGIGLIQQTNDGGYIAAGSFEQKESPYWDVGVIIKLDSAGNIIWQKSFGNLIVALGYTIDAIRQTSDGGYIAAGWINDEAGNAEDVWICKLNASGNIVWQKTYGGLSEDYANSIQQTSDGGYIIGAFTKSYSNGAYGSAWILKLKPTGAIEWQKTFGSHSNDATYISSISQTNDGNYIGTGSYSDLNSDTAYLWVLKMNSSGTILWQKFYIIDSGDWATSHDIHQINDGSYIIAQEESSCSSVCGSYGVMLKLDSSGNFIWAHAPGPYGDFIWQDPPPPYYWGSIQTVQQTSDNGYITIYSSYSTSKIIKTDSDGVNASCSYDSINEQYGTYAVGSQHTFDIPHKATAPVSDTNFIVFNSSIERITECGSTIPNLISIKPAIDDSTSTTPNGIIEENETISLIGNLENDAMVSADSVSGVLSSTSPIVINNPNATYPNIPPMSTQTSQTNYSITAPSANRQAPHWDIAVTESPSCTGCLSSAYHFTYHIGNSFNDVAPQKLFYPYIETIFHAGITAGCAERFYCPQENVPREQMAKFICASLQKAGGACPLMPCQSLFNDVPNQNPFCPYIEALYNEGMIAGCQTNPLLYCPGTVVSRQAMAKFLCNAMNAVIPDSCSYASCTGIFGDVPSANPFCPYIEGIYAAGIISGCQSSPLLFCPDNNVSREQMAKFLVNAFDFGL